MSYIGVFVLGLKVLFLLLFNLFIYSSFSFSFFAIEKRNKRSKRKRKHAAVSYALTGIEYVLRLTSKARPVNRLSFAHYRCLRSTFAVCTLYSMRFGFRPTRFSPLLGRVRVEYIFLFCLSYPKHAPYFTFTPNVTQ